MTTTKFQSAINHLLSEIDERGGVRLSVLQAEFSKSLVKYAERCGYIESTPIKNDFHVEVTSSGCYRYQSVKRNGRRFR